MRISDWSSDVCSSDLPFAQRVDRRVCDLAEILAEEMTDCARLVRNDGQWRVVTHGADGFLCVLHHRGEDQFQILKREIGRHLTPCQFRLRSEEHTSELQSLMRISYAVFCLKKKKTTK